MNIVILLYYFLSFSTGLFTLGIISLSRYKLKDKIITQLLISFSAFIFFIFLRIINEYYLINISNSEKNFSIIFSLLNIFISNFIALYSIFYVHNLCEINGKKIINVIIFSIIGIFFIFDILSHFFSFIKISFIEEIDFINILSIVYVIIILFRSLNKIENIFTKDLIKITLLFFLIIIPTVIIDSFHHINNLMFFLSPLTFIIANIFLIRFFLEKSFHFFEHIDTITDKFLKDYNITEREKEIISLLLKGFSYNKIADISFISLSTVKTHLHNIYTKTSVKSRHELTNLIKRTQ